MKLKKDAIIDLGFDGGYKKLPKGTKITTPEEQAHIDNYYKKGFNPKIRNFSNKHGGFTFLTTKENILQSMNPATVGRLAYLSTYLESEGQLLLYEDRPMLKNDLPIILNISRPTTNKFYVECISLGVLEDHGKDGLYLIGNLFFKGKSESKERTKLFRVTIQQLYKKLPQKKHELFGYVIQLVPWINFEWNIVCVNPEETRKDNIDPMSFVDICKKLGYDSEHPGRLKEALTSPIFVWEHYKQPLCGFFSMNAQDGRQSMMVVNPHILFAGRHIENVGILDVAFTPRKKKVRKSEAKIMNKL